MKILVKIFGASHSDNERVAEDLNLQIDDWKQISIEEECRVINVESITLTANSSGAFATVNYTFSEVFRKELLIEKMNYKENDFEKVVRDDEETYEIDNDNIFPQHFGMFHDIRR